MPNILISPAVPPRKAGTSSQASTCSTAPSISSAHLLYLQITSRKCPKHCIYLWHWVTWLAGIGWWFGLWPFPTLMILILSIFWKQTKVDLISGAVTTCPMFLHLKLRYNPTWHLKNTNILLFSGLWGSCKWEWRSMESALWMGLLRAPCGLIFWVVLSWSWWIPSKLGCSMILRFYGFQLF